jgi:divalent metal cation (Fe/Co/Zn/Cd) transporter
MIWLTGLIWIDGLVAIIFGLWIIHSGYKTLSNSIQSLLDRADEEKLNKLISLLNNNRREKWIDIHNLRIQKYGSQLHIDCHLTLPWYDSLEQTHKEVSNVEEVIHSLSDQEVEFFIHADPCLPDSCSICQLSNCPERKFEMTRKLEWTLENLIPDIKHTVQTK